MSEDGPCYYCMKPTNSLAGNPSQWPLLFCHADDPGKVKPHHVGCVSERLKERDRLRLAVEDIVSGHHRGSGHKSVLRLCEDPICVKGKKVMCESSGVFFRGEAE